jgi:hypothetical protein
MTVEFLVTLIVVTGVFGFAVPAAIELWRDVLRKR